MFLRDYLKDHGITLAQFGRDAGIGTKVRVHRLVHGRAFPKPHEMQLIRAATGGKVTPDDFVRQHAPEGDAPPSRAPAVAEAA